MAMDDLFSGSKNPASCSMRNAGGTFAVPETQNGIIHLFPGKSKSTLRQPFLANPITRPNGR